MDQNKRWYRWLKQATLGRHKALKHMYSDGHQLLAVNLGIVKLCSDGAYALLLATGDAGEGVFWRPELERAAPNGADGAKTPTLTETPKER